MKFRVSESTYLAISAAQTAVQFGSPVDADTVSKLLSALNHAADSVNDRARHIGSFNAWVTRMVEEGHLDLLPEGLASQLTDLHQRGISLAIDDVGLTGDRW